MNAKGLAGYPTTLLDPYGRALGYNGVGGPGGGDNVTWSGITTQSSFTSAEAPFPLLTLADTPAARGQCYPKPSDPVWEVSPFEFGSWDPAVKAFFPTQYLGTAMEKDHPVYQNKCTEGFDNIGLFIGISSNILTVGRMKSQGGTSKLTSRTG